jgi:hypothetical protein
MVIVPPGCGVPSESHQLPVAAVVVAVVVGGTAVLVVVVDAGMDVVVDVGMDVVVDVAQDASSIAATSKKLKPNHINLFFNIYLLFDYQKLRVIIILVTYFVNTTVNVC